MIFGENDNQPATPGGRQQQQIRIDTSAMDTLYANFFAIAASADEITIYLGANSPMPGVKEPVVKVGQRLLLLPQNAKRLLVALQQTVKAHEDRFGPIEITPPRPTGPGPN